jgi:hypothetical protein
MSEATTETPPRKFLTATTDYKITFGTAQASHDALLFNVPPTLALLLGVLELERCQLPSGQTGEAERKVAEAERKVAEAERKVAERSNKRIDNWMELLRLAGEPKLPTAAYNGQHKIVVAGVEVGFLNIMERRAWTVE